MLMPLLHVFVNLRWDAAVAVVLFVECGIHMVDNHTEIALQGVVVDRALPVAVNAVVYVCDDCFNRQSETRTAGSLAISRMTSGLKGPP